MCLKIEGSFFIITLLLLCEYFASYIALEFCVRFQSFQEFVCACDAGFLYFTPFTGLENAETMRKAWSGCERARETKRRRRASLFFPFKVWESYGRVSSHESLWAGQVRQTLHNFGSTSELCIISFFFSFFGCFSCVSYKVGRNTTRKVSSRHMMQWWYYLLHIELHNGWWVLDT